MHIILSMIFLRTDSIISAAEDRFAQTCLVALISYANILREQRRRMKYKSKVAIQLMF